MYGSTTKGDVVKRSDCILVYGSTTEGDIVKMSDCILVYESTTKGDVVKRCGCVYYISWNGPHYTGIPSRSIISHIQ